MGRYQDTFYCTEKDAAADRACPLSLEQNMNILERQYGGTTMLKRLVLTGMVELMVEFMAFGMLFAALGAWAIALAPVH